MERRTVLAAMLGLVTAAAWGPRTAPAADFKKITLRVEGMS